MVSSPRKMGAFPWPAEELCRRTEKQRSTEQLQVAAINRKKYTVYKRKTACVIQKAGFGSRVLREHTDLSDRNIKYSYYYYCWHPNHALGAFTGEACI